MNRTSALPLRHTKGDGLPHEGARIAETARAVGIDLMPWQAEAYAVATQREGASYRWPVVICSVPRQSGKSTLCRLLVLDRLVNGTAVTDRPWEAALTAQTRNDAARFLIDWGQQSVGEWGIVSTRGVGNEVLSCGRNVIRPYAPVPSAVHGRTLAAFLWDEAWSVDHERGREILQAAAPAMITRPDRQIWMVSTAGTAESRFFREWVERGAAGEACLIEYGAPPDADITDIADWARWHPAYGHTQDAAGIRQAASWFADDDAGFRRAYCNQWPDAAATVGAIHPDDWSAAADPDPPLPEHGRAVFALDVDPYGLSASIVAAWQDGARTRVEVADHREGASWLVGRVPELLQRHGARSVWAQDYGPAVATLDALERAKVKVEKITSKQSASAVQAFLTAVGDGAVSHAGQDVLTRSALAVGTRAFGDGVQWQRRGSGVTSPITAASWAVWAAARAKPRLTRPRVVILGAS